MPETPWATFDILFKTRQEGVKKTAKEVEQKMTDIEKQMRWIGRDFLRISMFVSKIGDVFGAVFGAMAKNSLTLNAALEDTTWVMDEMSAIVGDAVSPTFDWFSNVMEGVLYWVESLHPSLQGLIGMFAFVGQIVFWIVPAIFQLLGMVMILTYGVFMLTSQLEGQNVRWVGLGKVIGWVTRIFKPLTPQIAQVKGQFAGLNKSLQVTASSSLVAGKSLKKMGVQSAWSLRRIGKYGAGIGIASALTIGLTGALQGGVSAGNVFGGIISAVGMAMMFTHPYIGLVAMGIGGLITALTGGEKAGEANVSVMDKLIDEYGYAKFEAYDMSKRIKGAYDEISMSALDAAAKQDVFIEKLGELGVDIELAVWMWTALGGELVETSELTAEEMFLAFKERFEALPKTAEGAMILIRAALEDGAIDREEWEIITNTEGFKMIMQSLPVVVRKDFLESMEWLLKDGTISLLEWEAYMGLSDFQDATDYLYDKVEDEWIALKAYLKGSEVTELEWRDWLATTELGIIAEDIGKLLTFEVDVKPFNWGTWLGGIGRGIGGAISGFIDWLHVDPEEMGRLRGEYPLAQEGGITAREGLYHLHPNEAIIPLDRPNTFSTHVTIEQAYIRSSQDIYDLAENISEIQADRARRQGIMR